MTGSANQSAATAASGKGRRRGCAPNARRRGFTITELVVAIGILSILLVTAGGVFTLTLRSSGEASALISVQEAFRALEQNLAEDLRGVQSGASVLVVQGNTINAYWTEQGQELDATFNGGGDSPFYANVPNRDPERERLDSSDDVRMTLPCADLAMFFTQRSGRSFRDPDVTAGLQQVVWGHALVGNVDTYGDWITDMTELDYQLATVFPASDPPANNLPSYPLPAYDWHLARRSVLVVDRDYLSENSGHWAAVSFDDSPANLGSRSDAEDAYNGLRLADSIIDGRRDYVFNDSEYVRPISKPGMEGFNYRQLVLTLGHNHPGVASFVNVMPPGLISAEGYPDNHQFIWLIPWMARSKLIEQPPDVQQGERIGHAFLPNCASFKVEWQSHPASITPARLGDTLFDGEIRVDLSWTLARIQEFTGEPIWVDPGDMLGFVNRLMLNLVVMDADPRFSGKIDPLLIDEMKTVVRAYFDPGVYDGSQPWCQRFNPEFVGTSHVFYPAEASPYAYAGRGVPDPFFPKALRVTVDVFDAERRLSRPIRHVMVLPVGNN